MRRKVAYTSRMKEGSPAEEAAESPAVEATEQASAGGKPGPAGGHRAGHPLNLVDTTRAGHAQGAPGGRAIDRPIDKVTPTKVKTPLPTDPKKPRRVTPPKEAKGSRRFTGGERKNLGHFLGKAQA